MAMSFPNRRRAIRRSAVAGAAGVALVVLFGSQFVLPGIALVALVYFGHKVAAVLLDEVEVSYPGLAMLISVNALVVLAVQGIVLVKHFAST